MEDYEVRSESYLPCVQERLRQEKDSDKKRISQDDVLNLIIELNLNGGNHGPQICNL